MNFFWKHSLIESFLIEDLNIWLSYFLTVTPVVIYIIVCYKVKSEIQIKIAAIIGTMFAFVMISTLLGTISRILNSPMVNPSGIILYTIICIFLISGLIHPREFNCLYAGPLYYISVPCTFVLLNIYAIINLNNVSWGTRETKPSASSIKSSTTSKSLFSLFNSKFNNDLVERILKALEMTRSVESLNESEKWPKGENVITESVMEFRQWIDHPSLKDSKHEVLPEREEKFFNNLIDKYLYPNVDEHINKEKVSESLNELSKNCSYFYLLLNGFWLLIIFTLNILKFKLVDKIYFDLSFGSKYNGKYEPVSFIYISLFAFIMVVQFVAMLWHRTITFMQVMRNTSLTQVYKRNFPIEKHETIDSTSLNPNGLCESKKPGEVIVSL